MTCTVAGVRQTRTIGKGRSPVRRPTAGKPTTAEINRIYARQFLKNSTEERLPFPVCALISPHRLSPSLGSFETEECGFGEGFELMTTLDLHAVSHLAVSSQASPRPSPGRANSAVMTCVDTNAVCELVSLVNCCFRTRFFTLLLAA